MRLVLAAAATLSPAIAFAHEAVVGHAHPHEAAHPYLGIDALIAFAVGAAVVGGAAYGLVLRARRNK